MLHKEFIVDFNGAICHIDFFLLLSFTNIPSKVFGSNTYFSSIVVISEKDGGRSAANLVFNW